MGCNTTLEFEDHFLEEAGQKLGRATISKLSTLNSRFLVCVLIVASLKKIPHLREFKPQTPESRVRLGVSPSKFCVELLINEFLLTFNGGLC